MICSVRSWVILKVFFDIINVKWNHVPIPSRLIYFVSDLLYLDSFEYVFFVFFNQKLYS